jgi:hypothetical protein
MSRLLRHAGALNQSAFPLIERATRQTPIGIWIGTNDAFFPLKVVRATREALQAQGFEPQMNRINGHTHWYDDRAAGDQQAGVGILRQHALAGEPKYERYNKGVSSEVIRSLRLPDNPPTRRHSRYTSPAQDSGGKVNIPNWPDDDSPRETCAPCPDCRLEHTVVIVTSSRWHYCQCSACGRLWREKRPPPASPGAAA